MFGLADVSFCVVTNIIQSTKSDVLASLPGSQGSRRKVFLVSVQESRGTESAILSPEPSVSVPIKASTVTLR